MFTDIDGSDIGLTVFGDCLVQVAAVDERCRFTEVINAESFERRFIQLIEHGYMQPGKSETFHSGDDKIVALCRSDLAWDAASDSMQPTKRPQDFGALNNNFGRSAVKFFSVILALNFSTTIARIPVAKKSIENSRLVRDAMVTNQEEIYNIMKKINPKLFGFDGFATNTVSPGRLLTKMRGLVDKAKKNGILMKLSKSKEHPNCMIVRDFYLLQDILPGITIRSRKDLIQLQPIGGRWNDYLAFANDQGAMLGGSILCWRGVVPPPTKEKDAGEDELEED